jgi:hypothetical protein
MIWHLVLVFVLGGQQIEMVDVREFPNRQTCEAEAERLSGIPFIRAPAALRCLREDRA